MEVVSPRKQGEMWSGPCFVRKVELYNDSTRNTWESCSASPFAPPSQQKYYLHLILSIFHVSIFYCIQTGLYRIARYDLFFGGGNPRTGRGTELYETLIG